MNKLCHAITGRICIPAGSFDKCFFLLLFIFSFFCTKVNAQVTLTASAGVPSGSYATLKAAFDAINSGNHHGNIIISINASTNEGATPATLNSNDADPASYTSVLIQPTDDDIVVTGSPAAGFGVIQFNGADNITINGDNPGSPGQNRNLSVNNTATAASIGNSCIRIATSSVVTSADDISILNCILNGNVLSGNDASISAAASSSNISFGIYLGGNGSTTPTGSPTAITSETANSAPAGSSFKSFSVQNNMFNQCGRAVVYNSANAFGATSLLISQNDFGTAAVLGTYPYATPATTVYAYGIWVAGANMVTISGNTFSNIMSYLLTAMAAVELNANITGAIVISNNTVNNVVNNNVASAVATSGISIASAGSGFSIDGNNIANIENSTTASTGPADGIRINSTSAAGSITKNKINGIFNRNSNGSPAHGIGLALAANGILIQNNFISDVMNIGLGSFGNADNADGILVNSGSNHKIYHNSINLYGNSIATGTNSINCLAITSNALRGIDIRNNLFSNTVTGGAANNAHTCLFLPFGLSAAMNLVLNNNAYYTGNTPGLHGVAFAGSAFYTVPALYTVGNFNPQLTTGAGNWRNFSSGLGNGSNDFASFGSTAAAPFVSASDLHIVNASTTQLESGGVALGVSTDIDAAARNVNYPDIGADEFTGTIVDNTPPLVTYTPLENTCTTGIDRLLLVDIKDVSGVPVSGAGLPMLYFYINGTPQFPVPGVFISGNTYQFDFGTNALVNEVVTYYIVAQDNLGNVIAEPSIGAGGYNINPPFAATPPTMLSSYTVLSTLAAGTYDVGVGQTYTTITDAITAYNNSCPGGAIIFRLMDGTYPTETYPIVISNSQASAVNTLKIIPNTGVAVTVSGSNASALFKLNGTGYVTFDGINSGGSSLTVTNTNAASTATVFWIASANAAQGSSHNTIVNCTITGSGSNTTIGGIVSGSGTTLLGSGAAPNSNNTISSCIFQGMQNAIYINGYPGTNDQGWVITDNIMGSANPPEKLGYRGITLQWVNNFSITGNTISGLVMNAASVATGISISNYATLGNISGNNISDIKQNNVGGAAYGIFLGSSINISFVDVTNNFIADIYSIGSATVANNANGIVINSGGGYNIYYNSVNITAGAGAANSISAAIRISGSVTFANGLNVWNNIFSNSTATGNRFSIYNASNASVFSNINYNNYYSGSSPVLGYQGGNITALGAWQAATGDDAKSMSINPLFISATDSHLQPSSPMNAMAVTISGITTDIDGNARAAIPDIGADEITEAACSGTPTGGTVTAAGTVFCTSGSTYLSATGFTTGDGLSYQWQYSTDNFTTPINMAGQTTPSNVATGTILVTTYYRLKVTCANGGGVGYSNVVVVTINIPVVSTTTAATRCGTGTLSLAATTVTPGATLNWYNTPTEGTSLGTGSPFITPVISATTNYYVEASAGTFTGSVGPASPSAQGGTTGTQTVNWEVFFDVLQATTLVSVDIFPNTSGSSSSLLIRNSSGTLMGTIPYTTTVSGGRTAQTIPINIALPSGNNYYIEGAMPSGGLQRNTSGAAYPYNSSVLRITGNGFLNSYYMCYYNFRFSSVCASARTLVTATVTPAPAITPLATPAIICAGSSSSLSASSSNSGYTYTWNPGNITGNPVNVTPAATTTYTLTANDNSGGANNGCANSSTITVTVNQLPTNVTISPTLATVCYNATATQLTASGGFLNNITAISENFNGATNGWAKFNNSTGGNPSNAAWTLRPNGYIYDALTFSSNTASQFYLSNSADQGSGSTTNTLLQSPPFSLAGYTTANLSFWHYFRYLGGESAIVEVSTNGVSWTPLPGGTYTSTQGASNSFVNANLNMDAYAGQPIVFLRFNYSNATFAYYWAIDNISVTGNVNTTVTWTQAPAAPNSMYTDAGASIPYTAGFDANSIYVQPLVTTTYTATATGPAPSNCSKSGTSSFTVVPPVSVTISVTENPACPSSIVTFTANTVSAGPSPTYQWQVNGANVGANVPNYTYSPANGDQVKVIVNGNGSCTFGNPAVSNIITMSVTGPIAVGVTITANPGNFVCAGAPVTFTATPINGGPGPVYQWKKNGVNVGTNSPTYVYTFSYPENGDAITCVITSNSSCPSGSPIATSNQILMTVNPVGPTGVVIGTTLGSNTVCAGTVVTVRATPTNQGLAPIYEYFLNNISQGQQASNDFIFTPNNGDKVRVKLKSNYTCLTGPDTAKSNTITMVVLVTVPASVSLDNSAALCSGTPITFTATPTNGGTAPTYNFLLNGSSVQNTASNTYILNSPANGNTVQVIMTSNFQCISSNPASSSIITVALNASPTVTAAADCNNILPGSGQNVTLTATAAAGSGTISTYQWNIGGVPIPGANGITYTTNVAGSYTCTVTNSNSCSTTSSAPVVITSTGAALAAGTYTIPGTGCGGFDKISSAVNYINTYGVAGPVVFNIAPGYTETAPVGGYAITATGTAANTITFQRNGAGARPVITAGLQVAGSNNDAIFKIIGGDYISIKDLALLENPANTVTSAGATNTMTEWAVALLNASTTNGPNNNTIQGDSISLNSSYPNSFGIYSNLRHSAATPATSQELTNASGGQNKIYSNLISNVNNPVWLIGGSAAAGMAAGNDIGGASAATANTIINWGSNTVNSGNATFFGIAATMAGIYAANQAGINVSWNNVSSATGTDAGVAGLRGIYADYTSAPSGTFTNTIGNNSVYINSAATGGTIEVIGQGNTAGSAAVAGITTSIQNNTGSAVLTGTASATGITVINNAFPSGVLNITGNIIRGDSSSATTGSFTGIINTAAVATTINLNNNQLGDASANAITFSAAASGNVTGISNTAAAGSAVLTVNGNSFTRFVHNQAGTSNHVYISNTANPATQNISNNIFNALTLNTSGTITCINSFNSAASKLISGNAFTAISGGSGLVTVISATGSSTLATISSNNIGNNVAGSISGTGPVTGIRLQAGAGGSTMVSSNIISGLSQMGTATAEVIGIHASAPTVTITGNNIDTLQSSGNGSGIMGISVTAGTTVNISQNRVHSFNGTGTGNAYSTGISIAGGAAINIFKNRIFNLSQQGAGVAATLVNGVEIGGGTAVTVYNNFISELRAPAAGLDDAVRGISIISVSPTSAVNLYYNSIHLDATSTGINFGSTGIFHSGNSISTTATLTLRNNIINNLSVPNGTGKTIAFRRGSAFANLPNYGSASDHNDWYAGTPGTNNLIFSDGTNNDQQLSDFQARVSSPAREAASISVKPNFVNVATYPYDLHLQLALSCSFDGLGNNSGILIADDIDGDARSVVPAFVTDIGADEFNGTGVGVGVWKGVTNDWNDIQNWCDAIPNSKTNVTIPTGLSNYPLITTATPVANNISIAAGGSVTITGAGKLGIYGTITNAGTFNVVDGTIEMAGSAAQTIPAGAFQNNDLKNLIINNASVTLGGTLNLYGKLSYTGSNRAFATAGFLVLRSTATGTASVGDITNNGTSSGNTITGDVSVERFMSMRRAWRFLSAPTQHNLQNIHQAWQENQAANAPVPAGYGIQISSNIATWAADGFDSQTPAGPSMKTYNPATNAWDGIPATVGAAGNFAIGKAYMTLVRGDRTINFFQPVATTTTVLRDKGALVTGTFAAPAIGAGEFAAIGNPYASAVDFSKLNKSNLQDVYYLWDPYLGSLGGYVTFNGPSYNPVPQLSYTTNKYIESGQALFVKSSGLAGSLSFTEPSKVDGSYLVSRPTTGPVKQLRTNLYLVDTSGAHLYDGTLIEFDAGFTNGIDDQDAIKLSNFGENLGIRKGDNILSVERRADPSESDTIYIDLGQVRVKNYQFEFITDKMEQTGLDAYLEDSYNHSYTRISLSDTTRVNFNIINDPGSYSANRFRIVFKQLSPVPVIFTSVRALKQNQDIRVEWKVENELNIHHYEVERSADGRNFAKLHEQVARGNGLGGQVSYNWLDSNPFTGDNFYRIRSIGMTTEQKLSQVVRVNMGKSAPAISIFPNPVKEDGFVYISLNDQPSGNYKVLLLNNEGQTVLKQTLNHTGGSGVFSLILDKYLAHGHYILNIIGENGKSFSQNLIY